MMLLLPLLIFALFAALFFLILPDYLVQKENLSVKEGTIEQIDEYEYFDNDLIRDKTYDVVDIKLEKESVIIRLSDGLNEKYWKQINKKENIGKIINVLFFPRLKQGNLILNPQELTVDGLLILNFERSRKVQLWVMLGIVTLIILLSITEIVAIKSYKLKYYELDKKEQEVLFLTIIKSAFSVE
jgi:hypothetical protein